MKKSDLPKDRMFAMTVFGWIIKVGVDIKKPIKEQVPIQIVSLRYFWIFPLELYKVKILKRYEKRKIEIEFNFIPKLIPVKRKPINLDCFDKLK